VLNEVEVGNPVFLTKNGCGKFVIMHIDDFDTMIKSAWRDFIGNLDKAVSEAETSGWISEEEVDVSEDVRLVSVYRILHDMRDVASTLSK
jgi:hypothetical protein